MEIKLKEQIHFGIRHLLSEQDPNPYSPTYGCFDRRYWGWKLVDYSEATFQRAVYPLTWAYQHLGNEFSKALLKERIRAGLLYATKIQHHNGSFDQAFPFEQSFGATAFLLHPLHYAYQTIADSLSADEKNLIRQMLRRGADFLLRHDEAHAHIANHLAGAVLSLLICGQEFDEQSYQGAAMKILERILNKQSNEGWFVEYEGADPGYQTLCIYYLAQVYQLREDANLADALERSINFLSWFVHPDGSFGGEYGSRRTAIYYPGGLALLSDKFPLAGSINRAMLHSISQQHTTTVYDMDMGNIVPLLSNYILASEFDIKTDGLELPYCSNADCDFPEAGLYIRQRTNLYAIIGVSNGGVIKIFDKAQKTCLYNDGGYVAVLQNGRRFSSQNTEHSLLPQLTENSITIERPFYAMDFAPPSPFQMLLLRILNLTVMRHIGIGNLVKRFLVWLLISKKETLNFALRRRIVFTVDGVEIFDKLSIPIGTAIRRLRYGIPFSSIHMASSNYYYGKLGDSLGVELEEANWQKERRVYPHD